MQRFRVQCSVLHAKACVSGLTEGTSTRYVKEKMSKRIFASGSVITPLLFYQLVPARPVAACTCSATWVILPLGLSCEPQGSPTCGLQCLATKMKATHATHASLGTWVLTGNSMEHASSVVCPLCPVDADPILNLCFLTPECLTLPSAI